MRVAVYPGSFDPITNGHLDIIERSERAFDRIIVGVSNNQQKSHLFSLKARVALVKECVSHLPNVEVAGFDGLLIDFARKRKASCILRGLRAVSDFEYEFQLANMNRKLAPSIETVFMMTGEASFYISSRLVREIASFGGDVSAMVPKAASAALRMQFGKKKKK